MGDSGQIYDPDGFVALFGNLQTAVAHFDAVRYVIVSALTFVALDVCLSFRREVRALWSPLCSFRISFARLVYLILRLLTLAQLCINVTVATFNRSSGNVNCVWWLSLQAWDVNVILIMMHLVLGVRLAHLYNRKPVIIGYCALAITVQIITSCILLAKHPSTRPILTVPVPGFWFTGCFPYLSKVRIAFIWASAAASQGVAAGLAIFSSVQTWRHSQRERASLLAIAERDGIHYFLGIFLATIGSITFWFISPSSLTMIAIVLAVAFYAVFGSRLLLGMLDPRPHPHRRLGECPTELSAFFSPNDDGPGSKSGLALDLEMGMGMPLPSVASVNKIQMTPESDATLFLTTTNGTGVGVGSMDEKRVGRTRRRSVTVSPCPTISSREEPPEDLEGAGDEKALGLSPMTTTVVEVLSMTQLTTDDGHLRRPSLPQLAGPSTPTTPLQPGRRGFSEDGGIMPTTRSGRMSEEEFEELDRALEEEYDEEGRKRPPKRTHQRRWTSDEVCVVNTLAGFATVVLPERPALAYHRPQHQTRPEASSSASLPMPKTKTTESGQGGVRSRLSILLHRHHKSNESNKVKDKDKDIDQPSSPASDMDFNPCPDPISPSSRSRYNNHNHHRADATSISTVPEEDSSFRRSSPTPPPIEIDPPTPSPTARLSRRLSNKSKNAARIRRLLAANASHVNGPPSPRTTGRARGESDAATICSASTGWAFDNSNVHDVPDFCN